MTRTLKDCSDINLFQQESIKSIIDYKWDTYGRDFFLYKFYFYAVFLIFYYADIHTMDLVGEDGLRRKDLMFYVIKGVCTLINLVFFFYELYQMKNDGLDYFYDSWNYLELFGNGLYQLGAVLDFLNSEIDDTTRIVVSFSLILTLAKVVYLIRVFKQLNFLVTMLITVVNDIFYFMILFSMFLLTFSMSFEVLEVDMSAYGRTPTLMSYFISVLRCAMGDFSIIHMSQGFDIIDDPKAEGDSKYRFS